MVRVNVTLPRLGLPAKAFVCGHIILQNTELRSLARKLTQNTWKEEVTKR